MPPKRARSASASPSAAKRRKAPGAVRRPFPRDHAPRGRAADYAEWMEHLAARKGVAQRTGKPYFEHGAFRVKQGLIKSLRGVTAPLEARFHNGYRLPGGDGGGAGRRGGSETHFDLAYAYTFKKEPLTDMGRMIKKALDGAGYEFKQAETTVMFGAWGTAADAVFRTREGKYVVVEYKTGMGHAFTGHHNRADHRMSDPLSDYLMCPEHAALLQAITTALMLEATFGCECGVRVVHVADGVVSIFGDRDTDKVAKFRAAALRFLQLGPSRT